MSYVYLMFTVLLTVYCQFIIKWQVGLAGPFPTRLWERFGFLGRLLLNPVILSAFAAGLFASLCWMIAITRLELSQAYPIFVGATFVLIFLLGAGAFGEQVTLFRLTGAALILSGIALGSR